MTAEAGKQGGCLVLVLTGMTVVLVIGILVFTIGFALFTFSTVLAVIQLISTVNWATTSGTITTSFVPVWNVGADGRRPYVVEYSYTVNGAQYANNRVRVGGLDNAIALENVLVAFPFLTQAPTTVDAYPAGKQVMVMYNPADPRSALLERTLPPYMYVILVFNSLALLWNIRNVLRRRRAKAAQPTAT